MSAAVGTYEGRPCTVSEMAVGNTLFTVISVQSDFARETAFEKVKKTDPGQLHINPGKVISKFK